MTERNDTLSTTVEHWVAKAELNIDRWGLQDRETLVLAMQEELGELAQAVLEHEHEDGEYDRIGDELDDLAALCVQLDRRLADE